MALAQLENSILKDAPLRKSNGFDLELAEQEVPAAADWLVPDLLPVHDLPESLRLGAMAGRSPVMQHLFARMRCTAPHFRLATVEGEPGAGKMLAARTLHRLGPSASGPFAPWVAAEFLANPTSLWKDARGGLLYLSRIEELSAEQQRLLRDFLERAAHERIRIHTASGPLQLITGSLQPLRRLAAAGAFRPDLASHLTAIRFALPPLRERRDDIPLLAGLFLRQKCDQLHKSLRGFAPGALARLTAYSWPGNVRELESIMATAALEAAGQWIRPIDIPRLEWPVSTSPSLASDFSADDPNLDRAILRHVTRILARVSGNKVRAARMLGISRSTLYRMLEGGALSADTLPPGASSAGNNS